VPPAGQTIRRRQKIMVQLFHRPHFIGPRRVLHVVVMLPDFSGAWQIIAAAIVSGIGDRWTMPGSHVRPEQPSRSMDVSFD